MWVLPRVGAGARGRVGAADLVEEEKLARTADDCDCSQGDSRPCTKELHCLRGEGAEVFIHQLMLFRVEGSWGRWGGVNFPVRAKWLSSA